MTTPLARRLGRLEETRRRLIRERVLRLCSRLGADLSPAEIEALVTRHVGTPARIDRMRREGLTHGRILARLMGEIPTREAA
jgi:hypothetical protein